MSRTRLFFRIAPLVLCATLALPCTASADILVVSHSQSPIASLSREEAINIYMGRFRRLPDGTSVHPLDQADSSPARRVFYRQLLNKSLEEINAYWARLLFSGRTTPPAQSRDLEELLARLARDPGAIGYIDRSQMTGSAPTRQLRILLTLPE